MQTSDIHLRSLGAYLPPFTPAPPGAPGEPDGGLTGALVAGDVPPPEMAVRAVRQAFERGAVDPSEIDILLHAAAFHQGPDGWLPPSYIQRETLGTSVPAIEIRQGCNGMFSALELAVGHLRAVPGRSGALITSADNFDSPVADRWTAHPGSYLGDAGCAVVIGTRPGFARLLSVATVSVPEMERLHRGDEPLFPPSGTAGRPMAFGPRAAAFRAGGTVPNAPELLSKARAEVLGQVLREADADITDMKWVISMNNSRPHVSKRVTEPLGLPFSRSAWEFGSTFGHLAACDQFVTLERMVTLRRVAPGDRVLMIGVGPGVSIGGAVVEIAELPDWE